MIRRSKWIEGISGDQLVGDVASLTLAARLELVWYYLPRAANEADRDTEHVHQLRVATRRAQAAMDIFGDLLPAERAEWIEKKLKKIRRAAGEARDYDVLGARLAEQLERGGNGALTSLLKRIRQLRSQTQPGVRKIYRQLGRKQFDRRISKLLWRVRWRGSGDEPRFDTAAIDRLRPLVDEFFSKGTADFSDVMALHAFRIQGKRLRYAMEIFAGAFDPTFRKQLYPLVEELQEQLGQVNDHATALAYYQQWLDQAEDDVQAALLRDMIQQETAALVNARQAFLSWWTPERRENLRLRFREVLGESPAESSTNGRISAETQVSTQVAKEQ